MDIGLFILLMIIMYVVPEFLKRWKPKKPYQYPEFPPTLPQDGQGPMGIPGELSRGVKPPVLPIMTGEGMPGDEGDPAWSGKAAPVMQGFTDATPGDRRWDAGNAVQGLIWAEIIAPPVALRSRRCSIRRI